MCGFVFLLFRSAHPPRLPLAPEWALWIPGENTQSLARRGQSWAQDAALGQGRAVLIQNKPLQILSSAGELPLHPMFSCREVSPASPLHNHQFHLQFFNKLLNYTSLNDTLQIQQVLIANDGSERLSFDCN